MVAVGIRDMGPAQKIAQKWCQTSGKGHAE